MSKTKILHDPYSALSHDNRVRIGGWVSLPDYAFLRSVRPSKGTVQLVIHNLLFKLINECRKRNITDWGDEARFERFVDEFVFEWPTEHVERASANAGGSPSQLIGSGETVVSNERRGVEGQGNVPTSEPHEFADLVGNTGSGSTTRKKCKKVKREAA